METCAGCMYLKCLKYKVLTTRRKWEKKWEKYKKIDKYEEEKDDRKWKDWKTEHMLTVSRST